MMTLFNLLILFIVPLLSGSIDSFDNNFVQPSIAEQQMYKSLLEEFLKFP